MKAGKVTAHKIGIGLALVAALLGASACAAGQYAQTATENETLDGAKAQVGSITMAAFSIITPSDGISYAKGADVPVRVVIVNSGEQPDTLTSISSPSFSSWGTFASAAAARAAQQAKSAAASTPALSATPAQPAQSSTPAGAASSSTPAGAASNSGPVKGSKTPKASATAPSTPAAPAPSQSVTVGPHSAVSFGTPNAKGVLLLSGINTVLHPGMAIDITVTFERAGTVTVRVPVALTAQPQTSIIPGPSATGQESPAG